MKILYVADGRSPIALNWISYFIRAGHAVHLASTFPCPSIEGLASLEIIPVAMSGMYGNAEGGQAERVTWIRRLFPVRMRTLFRQFVAPFSLRGSSMKLQHMIERIQPDIVHAMRIPFEGMLASKAIQAIESGGSRSWKPPLLISVWGNDFTLHARATPGMFRYTRQALQAADGLHTDCQRDQRLAVELGFSAQKPAIVLPGGGGIQVDTFYPSDIQPEEGATREGEGVGPITIINPRGIRAYVRNDTFFHAIPLVIRKFPNVRFICIGMLGVAQAEKWCNELKIGEKVELLPAQSRLQMAELFRQSQVTVSITTHDGTPNTLLEAMACGSFPIVGDIESLHEWITQGENGLLVDPGDPNALAEAILTAISQPELSRHARELNLQLVRQRAEYGWVMQQAQEFYKKMISKGRELN
jgi:glycosyltransferase involved in cell wall biosynthesis